MIEISRNMRSRPSIEAGSAVPLLPSHEQEENGNESGSAQNFGFEHEYAVDTANGPINGTQKPRSTMSFTGTDWMTIFLPSFITYWYFRKPQSVSPAGKWYPTAFLDGLRGVACIAVLNDHLLHSLGKWHANGWGRAGTDNRIWQLPVVRLLHDGPNAVMIFFVISGFALSASCARLMQTDRRDTAAFAKSLASSVFRRPLRLYLPAWASTIPAFLCFRLRIYAAAEPLRTQSPFEGWPQPHVMNDTLSLQTVDLFQENTRMLDIFRPVIYSDLTNRYNPPTWTIPVEFRASLVLYLTQAALFHLGRRSRWSTIACAIALSVFHAQRELPLFWVGFLLAEWFFLEDQRPSLAAQSADERYFVKLLRLGLPCIIFIFGLWVGSFPEFEGPKTPGYRWLTPFTPGLGYAPGQWWHSVSAICIVGVCVACARSSNNLMADDRLSRLQRLLTDGLSSPFCRYLGKISFSLYLTHAVLVQTFGVVVFYSIWSVTGNESTPLCGLGFTVGYVLLLATAIWAADLFWRFVDQPSVDFAKWLHRRCSIG